MVSEKYIEAGLYLAKDDKIKSKELFEEIIYEKNSFYSLLSLNTLIEKNLVTDTKKVLNYFEIIESINYSKEQKDLITFKKGLYLIKNSKDKDLLDADLIAKNSKLGELDAMYVSVINQLISKIETLETKVAALES